MYADFSYYKGTYSGTLVTTSDEYAPLARRASLHIDLVTFNRLNTGWAVTDKVKMATCAVVDAIKNLETAESAAFASAGLKSENNDGYSVSYNDSQTVQASIDAAMTKAARPYLLFTGLMDRSVCV